MLRRYCTWGSEDWRLGRQRNMRVTFTPKSLLILLIHMCLGSSFTEDICARIRNMD